MVAGTLSNATTNASPLMAFSKPLLPRENTINQRGVLGPLRGFVSSLMDIRQLAPVDQCNRPAS